MPIVGEDDTYPKDRRGRPIEPVKFTIRAEKCPNRRGVEEVLRALRGFGDLVLPPRSKRPDAGRSEGDVSTGGYPDKGTLDVFGREARRLLLAVTEIFRSDRPPIMPAIVFPATAFSEKEGTYVNHAGLAQAVPAGLSAARRNEIGRATLC